jgi:hypothetical protein
MTLTGAVMIVTLLAVLGSAATAQSPNPGARVTQFTGAITEERWITEGSEDWETEGVLHSQNNRAVWTVEWTDPRLPTTMWQRIDYEQYPTSTPEGALPYAVSVLLEGEDGSWVGDGRGVGYDEGFVQVILEGQGAYEGLYAILDRKDTTLPDGTVERTFDGFIVEGELTTMPGPVVPVGARAAQGAATPVTGTRLTVSADAEPGQLEGLRVHETIEWSDPRLPAEQWTTLNTAVLQAGQWAGHILRGSTLLEGPEGYWTGTSEAFVGEDGTGRGIYVYTGHGAYEGLSAVLSVSTGDPNCVECMRWEGYIYEGALPLMPSPSEPSSG